MYAVTMGGLLLLMTIAGPAAGPLPPCPRTPNCVSTQASGDQAIAPFPYSGTAEQAMKQLLSILRAMPRTVVTIDGPAAIRAEFTTRVFRFTDDALFVIDDSTKTIHFRSASRVGRRDFGVNRRRMEEIRRSFEGR